MHQIVTVSHRNSNLLSPPVMCLLHVLADYIFTEKGQHFRLLPLDYSLAKLEEVVNGDL